MGSSRLTGAFGFRREKEVRSQVSWARSLVNDNFEISTAVRQTPLTEILSPCFNSLTSLDDATVKRRCWPLASIEATRPSSSMIPVNIGAKFRSFKISNFEVSRFLRFLKFQGFEDRWKNASHNAVALRRRRRE